MSESLPWPAEELQKAQRLASAAGWSDPELRGFLNALAKLPEPPVDLLVATRLAIQQQEELEVRAARHMP